MTESVVILLTTLALVFVSPTHSTAAEISSNGIGGGLWSDPATWRGKMPPGPEDDVVVQKYDVVTFDRNDEGKASCRKLLIDPRGVLAFKTGAGKIVCSVADAIESFGVIKLDGAKSASDSLELRMIGDSGDKRKIKLAKGAGLLLYGKANLPEGRRNVALSSWKASDSKEEIACVVEADGAVSIDWQRASIRDVKLSAKKIDNTGARPNERLNILDNHFTGIARIWCQACDTPIIARNTFEYKGAKPFDAPAIDVSYSPLTEIKGNTIHGGFAIGITVNYQSDSILVGNTIEKCTIGLNGGYGIPNTMIKKCVIRGCPTGIKLEGGSGVLEECQVEEATTAFHQQNADLQLNDFRVKDLGPKGTAVVFDSGLLTMLNCNITPAQIKMLAQPASAKPFPVTMLQYTVIGVEGAPADSLVEIRSANAPKSNDAADGNVRNSPAPLSGGMTPLPRTLNPLIVKGWRLDAQGKLHAAPEYTVRVLGPSPREGEARPTLKTVMFQPQENAFRASLDDPTPSLKVSVK